MELKRRVKVRLIYPSSRKIAKNITPFEGLYFRIIPWLGIKNDYRILIGLEGVNVVENLLIVTRMKAMSNLLSSRLYNDETFYAAFARDLRNAKHNVVIESPFITAKRMKVILPVIRRLRQKGAHVALTRRQHGPEGHLLYAQLVSWHQA